MQAVKILAILHHDGGDELCVRLRIRVQIRQIGQSVCHSLVDGVSMILSRVIVLDLFADLMDVGAACGNGVGLHLHLILRDGLVGVLFPGRSAGLLAGSSCCPLHLDIAADRGCGGRFTLLIGRRIVLLTGRCIALLFGRRIALLSGRCIALLFGRRIALLTGRRIVLLLGRRIALLTGRRIALLCRRRIVLLTGRCIALLYSRRTLLCRWRSCRFTALALCVGCHHHGAEGKQTNHGAEKYPHRVSVCALSHPCVQVHPFFPE